MDDNALDKPVFTRDKLVRQGTSAIANLAGGAFLLIMTMGARFRFVGIALSAAALILGLTSLFSKEKTDKKAGLIITLAGIMGMVVQFGIPLLRPIASSLLIIGALGLFASGIWKGVKFLVDLHKK